MTRFLALSLVQGQATWWHYLASWGNIGSAVSGLAAGVLAVAAIIGGSAGLQDWREKQREQAALARQEAENLRLDRMRTLYGWSSNGVEVYGVELVNTPDQLRQAAEQLAAGGPTSYVIVRVSEKPDGNENRANNLRQLVNRTGYLTRPPERGEYEALELGRQTLLAQLSQTS